MPDNTINTVAQIADMSPEEAFDNLCASLGSVLTEAFFATLERFSVDALNHLGRAYTIEVKQSPDAPAYTGVSIWMISSDMEGDEEPIEVVGFDTLQEAIVASANPSFQLTLIHAFIDLSCDVENLKAQDQAMRIAQSVVSIQ